MNKGTLPTVQIFVGTILIVVGAGMASGLF
jgi:hypothetical protein